MGPVVNYYSPQRISLSEKPPFALKAEPKYKSDKPLYGVIQLGTGPENRIVLVLDEVKGETPRIYVDRNNDKDLTNDGDGQWTNARGQILQLSNVQIEVPYETGHVPYSFDFYRFTERLRDVVLYYRNSGREGEIVSEGKHYKVMVLDENADGRFDDLKNDTIIIDLNQDGKLEGNSDSAEWDKLSEPFNINGKVWEAVSVSPDGLKLTLARSSAKVAMKAYLDPGYPAPIFQGLGNRQKAYRSQKSGPRNAVRPLGLLGVVVWALPRRIPGVAAGSCPV